MLSRRGFLGGVAAALAAPYVIRDSGILMPVRRRLWLPTNTVHVQLVWGVTGPSHWELVSDDDNLLRARHV